METPASFASQLATRYLTGVPIEELNTYTSNLAAVTAEDALAAAAQHVNSENPIIVVVGDAASLIEQLDEIAPVLLLDGDGNLIDLAE
jgi:predicted Zn-dependent peptidase